jgi:hypothetical protein
MSRVLAPADWHTPYMHPDYLEWVESLYKKYKCDTIVHCGDLRDFHRISFHENEPGSYSDNEEVRLAREQTAKFFKKHPIGYMCESNHDKLPYRKAKSVGMGEWYLKSKNDILGIPDGWKVADYHIIDGVRYEHGDRKGGQYGYKGLAVKNRMSTVSGHSHAYAGIAFIANDLDMIFGMNVGSGVDRDAIAMAYGMSFPDKPILSCGIVIDGSPYLEIMDLGKKVKLK